MKITLIVGLPGSGKTHLAKTILKGLLEEKPQECSYLLDDPKTIKEVKKCLDCDNLIITDPHLCLSENRDRATKFFKENRPNAIVEWIFFENNLNQCLINIEKSDRTPERKKVTGLIEDYSTLYFIPPNYTTMKVFKC